MIDGLISDDETAAAVEAVISTDVNPSLASHGGFVLLSVTMEKALPISRWVAVAMVVR